MAVTWCWVYKENEVLWNREEDMICLEKIVQKSQKNLEKKVKKLWRVQKSWSLDVKSHSSSVGLAAAEQMQLAFKPACSKAEAKPAAPKASVEKESRKACIS